jgi:hypothetical protein
MVVLYCIVSMGIEEGPVFCSNDSKRDGASIT